MRLANMPLRPGFRPSVQLVREGVRRLVVGWFVKSKCEHMSYDTIHKKTGLRPEEVDYLVQQKVLQKRRGKRRSYVLGKTGEAMRAEALWAAEQQRQIASQRETHAQQREPVFEGIRAEAECAGRARLEQRLSSAVCVAPPDGRRCVTQR